MRAVITGVSGYVPPDVLTNHDLEKMVDTNDEWIVSRTGIEQRHILKGENLATSDMCVEAMKVLLEKTDCDPGEIDLIICATVTPDMTFPDTANTIADKIGAKNCFAYDINAACSGFLFALFTGSKFIETGTYKKVVVIGADMMSSIINYKDRTTCIIFGDGAGAVLLEPGEENGVIDAIMKGDGSGRHFLHKKAGGSLMPASVATLENDYHYAYQEGRTVFKSAVKGMVGTTKDLMERNKLTNESLDWLVPHQANIRIINSVAEQLDYPKEKVMVNIQNYGNTTAGTLPLCLRDYESKLKKGDDVILTAFGGGFTWGSLYLKWNYDYKG
jgi:3-oxoacyl-[acyl-carrier-protein] synthase-3